jgi:hypothetical protein
MIYVHVAVDSFYVAPRRDDSIILGANLEAQVWRVGSSTRK